MVRVFASRRSELDLRRQLPRHQIRDDFPGDLSRWQQSLHVAIFADKVGVGKLDFE